LKDKVLDIAGVALNLRI